MRREEEEQQQQENGQTRTGANHRRARVARPHEVGQQEEQTRGKRTSGREEDAKDERVFGFRKKGQEKYGNNEKDDERIIIVGEREDER